MKKIILLILIIALLAGCSAAPDISLATVEKSGYFIAGYNPDNYHTFMGYGLAIDIIKAAAERMGIEAPILPVSEDSWETSLENKQIDIMLCVNSDTDFQTGDLFSDNIVFVKSDREEISTVGIIDSEACIAQKNILNQTTSYKYLYYSDSNLLLNDLEIGIVDGAILSEYAALSRDNISDFQTDILYQFPVRFVVSYKNYTFYQKINSVLEQMVRDGTIERLKQEHISNS